MDDEDYALSQLLNATSPSPFLTSPTQSPAPEPLPQVQRRPISKRRGKKRSSRACGACRTRKVRCNIVAHGAPCSNCRHDEVDCVLPLSRRQKSARERMEREQREQSMRGAIFSAEVGESGSENGGVETTAETTHQKPARAYNSPFEPVHSMPDVRPLAPHGMAISEHPLAEILPASAISPIRTVIPPLSFASSRTNSWIQIAAPLASAPTPRTVTPQLPRLPSIFAPFPRHLDPHDLSYLHSRDALTLPPEALQISLLRAYVEFVHPQFPLLDLEDFLSVAKYGLAELDGARGKGIEREDIGKSRIPFLLFQAVMFAGVEFVAMKALRQAGHKTKEEAKKAFFGRVRLLYDFDTCTDRLSIIQSLLLMTLSPPSSHDTKDSWHWLGLAISLSYSLGLNRTALYQQLDSRRKHLERRVWWTAFMRDRSLALNTGARVGRAMPVRIKTEDCDVEMLSLRDFELAEEDIDSEEWIEELKVRNNAHDCVEKAKLCWYCDEVLVSNSSATGIQPHLSRLALPQHVFVSQQTNIVQSLHRGDFEAPAFESQENLEYHIATSSSSPSAHDDCVTPREYEDEYFEEDDIENEKLVCSSPLGAGYGVDGEYDDYLEFLECSVIGKGKEGERSTRAFQ